MCYLILLIILICLLYYVSNYNDDRMIEGAGFALDTLKIPVNPVAYNEIAVRNYVRIIGIDKHIKLDKYDNVEEVLFKKPTPESGETYCSRVTCPYWMEKLACWKCF